MMLRRMLALFVFVLVGVVLVDDVNAQGPNRPIEAEALGRGRFAILPWDQMQLIDGPEDKVHGLASLAECNFTYAGFPRAADLPGVREAGVEGDRLSRSGTRA